MQRTLFFVWGLALAASACAVQRMDTSVGGRSFDRPGEATFDAKQKLYLAPGGD